MVEEQKFGGIVMWGRLVLKKAFSPLFSLASHKNATVVDMWERGGSGGQWLV